MLALTKPKLKQSNLPHKAPSSILRALSSTASTEWGLARKKSVTRLAPICRCFVGSCIRQRPEIRNSVCKQLGSPEAQGPYD